MNLCNEAVCCLRFIKVKETIVKPKRKNYVICEDKILVIVIASLWKHFFLIRAY